MRARIGVIAFLLVVVGHAAADAQVRIVLCRDGSPPSEADDRWVPELTNSFGRFLRTFPGSSQTASVHEARQEDCPRQAADGCYSDSGSIYCSRSALTRAVSALAVLRRRVDMVHPTLRLDALGRGPFNGFNALLSIDFVLFPEWGTMFRVNGGPGVPDTWLATARGIHQDPATRGWTMALDLVTWFIAGHEAFHAQGTCAMATPSFAEATGYLDSLARIQQEEFFCPNPPENVELNADACGLRWIEAADAPLRALDVESRKLARGTALLVLSVLFSQGLGARMEETAHYRPTGYLYPHLRTAAVHRVLFRLNEGDVRLGLCGDVLRGMWMNADATGTCVTREGIVELLPERLTVPAFSVLPSVEVRTPIPLQIHGANACLAGTSSLPALMPPAPRGGLVTISVVAVESLGNVDEDRSSRPVPESVRRQLRRPYLHAALSACLPPDVPHRRFRLRFTRAGPLDEVTGVGMADEKRCVQNVLSPFRFATFYGSSEGAAGAEPAFALVLELRRKQ